MVLVTEPTEHRIDGRCSCGMHGSTSESYWMFGTCDNCFTDDTLLVQFRRGEKKHEADCPVCGCRRTVRPTTLARVTEETS